MITLYSKANCPSCHACRFALYEKAGLQFEIRDVDFHSTAAEEVASLTPYGELPVLVERNNVFYNQHIINEYLDERFPHPPIMPLGPALRARTRLFLYNLERELFSEIPVLEKSSAKMQEKARLHLRDVLTQMAPTIKQQKWMLGDEFSILDISIAPLLWRLGHYGIVLPPQAAPTMKYAERIFSRPAFQDSLTVSEKVMRR